MWRSVMVGLVPMVVKMQVWSSLVTSPIQTSVDSHQDINSHWFLELTFSFVLDLSFLLRWAISFILVFTSHTDASLLGISFSRLLGFPCSRGKPRCSRFVAISPTPISTTRQFIVIRMLDADNQFQCAFVHHIFTSSILSRTYHEKPQIQGSICFSLEQLHDCLSIFVQRIRPLAIPELSSILPFHGCL